MLLAINNDSSRLRVSVVFIYVAYYTRNMHQVQIQLDAQLCPEQIVICKDDLCKFTLIYINLL